MGEVIVITSGKGGVGKTTTTANIGIGLSGLGQKVMVIDTDLGLRNLPAETGFNQGQAFSGTVSAPFCSDKR